MEEDVEEPGMAPPSIAPSGILEFEFTRSGSILLVAGTSGNEHVQF
jgi:hypothetical protein